MASNPLGLQSYFRRRPVILAMLTVLATFFFLVVTGISHIYGAQQRSLAKRWSERGAADLQAQHYADAVAAFRTALLYDRGSYTLRLSLAQALLGIGRTDEAYAYLINLWNRRPEDGLVNLELARIAAARNDSWQAMRYYHNAIYATWSGDQETESRNARLELIQYLLRIHASTQAQAELIAFEASLGEDSSLQEPLGELFLKAQDSQHALAAFQRVLRRNRHDQAALTGAGIAAYQLGRYPAAQRYLEEALLLAPGDQSSSEWLHKTVTVLMLDPYRPRTRATDRDRIVMQAFAVAGARLKSCTPAWPPDAAAMQTLKTSWSSLQPGVTLRGLRRDPDRINQAMDLTFAIERKAGAVCGPGDDGDQALLLIANLHEEN